MSKHLVASKNSGRKRIVLIALAVILLVPLILHFVPVSQFDDPCNDGKTYRVISNELDQYFKAKDAQEKWMKGEGDSLFKYDPLSISCPAYIHPSRENELYVL